jgi:hypothetical protein
MRVRVHVKLCVEYCIIDRPIASLSQFSFFTLFNNQTTNSPLFSTTELSQSRAALALAYLMAKAARQ